MDHSLDCEELDREDTKAFYLSRRQITSLYSRHPSLFDEWLYLRFGWRHHDFYSLWMALILGGAFMMISGLLLGERSGALMFVVFIIIPLVWMYVRDRLQGYRALHGYARMIACDYVEFNSRLSALLDDEGIRSSVHGVGFRRSRKFDNATRNVQDRDERLLGYVIKIVGTPVIVSSWEFPIFDEDRYGTLVHVSPLELEHKTSVKDIMSLVDRVADQQDSD